MWEMRKQEIKGGNRGKMEKCGEIGKQGKGENVKNGGKQGKNGKIGGKQEKKGIIGKIGEIGKKMVKKELCSLGILKQNVGNGELQNYLKGSRTQRLKYYRKIGEFWEIREKRKKKKEKSDSQRSASRSKN